jgi:uncharacterized pyridoxamine 5'-phosphate oxidase family protein
MNKKIIDFIKNKCDGIFHFATISDNEPKVRPFGFIEDFSGKIYFTTRTTKDVCQQLKKNANFEICATSKDAQQWIRIKAKAVFDDKNIEIKRKAFEVMPIFNELYQNPENPEFSVFYATDICASIYSMSGSIEKIS